MRHWHGVIATIALDEEWGIVKWGSEPGRVWYDIHHLVEDCKDSWSHDKIEPVCGCGAIVPEAVQGFLVICRSRNEETEYL